MSVAIFVVITGVFAYAYARYKKLNQDKYFKNKSFSTSAVEKFQANILDEFEKNSKNQENKFYEETKNENKVYAPILIYHSTAPYYRGETRIVKEYTVTPESFERQLKYLKNNNFSVISLENLSDYLLKKSPVIPVNPVALTFDDGWENQYKYAFPLLKKYGFTATFFVPTNFIGHRHFLKWNEIKEMDSAGMSIEDHTKSHPYLFKIKDEKVLRDEIIGSKKILESRLGKSVNLFAYPFGSSTSEIINVVKEAGFKSARTTYYGNKNSESDIYNLKAILVPNDYNKFLRAFRK